MLLSTQVSSVAPKLYIHGLFRLLAIKFADAFLLQEDTTEDPSPASGAKTYAGELNGVLWLVEKRRSHTLHRFSGTLHHPALGSDLRSSTVSAFIHFSYGHSNNTLIFADMQGKSFHYDDNGL